MLFEGTESELEAAGPHIRSLLNGQEMGAELSASVERAEAATEETSEKALSPEEALKVIRYRGGLSDGQREFLQHLFEADGSVRSADLREALGWNSSRQRGVMGALSRRVRGALGQEVNPWRTFVDGRWMTEHGEMKYELPENLRKALADELGW